MARQVKALKRYNVNQNCAASQELRPPLPIAEPVLSEVERIANYPLQFRLTKVTSDNATEEFKRISEFMRTYLVLRLYRLTLLLGTSGAIITALASDNIRARGATVILLLKLGAVAVGFFFMIMDFSASGHWTRLRDRANELAGILQYQRFPSPSRWSPFTANAAGNYLHVLIFSFWVIGLILAPAAAPR
jgi:hypothetical protein